MTNSHVDLLAHDPAAEPWLLDASALRRGLDNYHVDVRISPRFSAAIRKLASALLDQETSPTPRTLEHAREIEALRSAYLDLKTVLFNRTKTDLSAEEVQLLEFALARYVLETVRQLFDELIAALKAKATEYRERGSSEALSANQHLVNLQRHYDAILFEVNRQIFTQMQRLETRQPLSVLRDQYLHNASNDVVAALHNPMLFTGNISAVPFLLEQYRLWGCQDEGEDSGFNAINREVETVLARELAEFSILPLYAEQTNPEVHDALGGLLQTQRFMGVAVNQKAMIREDFCWLDNPLAVSEIFAIERFPQLLADVRHEHGFRAWWRLRKQTRRLERILATIAKRLHKLGLYRQLIAAQQVSRVWNQTLAERVDPRFLCQYFSGQITMKQLQERAVGRKQFPGALVAQLEKNAEEVEKQSSAASPLNTMLIVEDVSRYRLHLKYYRLAHRAFNRLKILKTAEEIQLSRESGSLYSLVTANEREDNERRVAQHAIMKADVRGSTIVTNQLIERDLNPASYFSMRFFNPINEVLKKYAATKVFIEGDALILSFLEYEAEPQQWFSVARACGLARTLLRIVNASNHYAKQIDLPPLELGIGICYSPEAPHYLYDEDKPVMISSAIGRADRLSSCSWKLRQLANVDPFNVAVYQLDESDQAGGDKGQLALRYNVNGILLENAAFDRLKAETNLRPLSMKIHGKQVPLHAGKYPDSEGRIRQLLIREGRTGLWRGDKEVPDNNGDVFYEVVVNQRIIAEVLKE